MLKETVSESYMYQLINIPLDNSSLETDKTFINFIIYIHIFFNFLILFAWHILVFLMNHSNSQQLWAFHFCFPVYIIVAILFFDYPRQQKFFVC